MAITAENARELQLKGAAAKRLQRANRELAMAKIEIQTQSVEYQERVLARVRLQLDKIYEQFMSEKDPQKLDRLAAAQSRLAEQERQLAGRPMPGSLRPMQDRKPRRSSEAATEPETP